MYRIRRGAFLLFCMAGFVRRDLILLASQHCCLSIFVGQIHSFGLIDEKAKGTILKGNKKNALKDTLYFTVRLFWWSRYFKCYITQEAYKNLYGLTYLQLLPLFLFMKYILSLLD